MDSCLPNPPRSTGARSWLVGAALLLACGIPAAHAELCALDDVPAATLLVPYFEVDLATCGSTNTLVTVLNTVPDNTLVYVTLWTDWGQPTIGFHMYLTGYDVETIDLGAAFCDGSLPVTGPTVSNHGNLSDPPGAPSSCDSIFPFPDPVIFGTLLDRLRNGHTGQPHFTFDGFCAGQDYDDDIARGYLTIDVVTDCQLVFPTEPGYFDGIAALDNILLGEVVETGPLGTFAQPVVHLEADEGFSFFAPGDHTFYGRLVDGQATDRREPLGTTYGMPLVGDPAATELVVWREHFGGNTATCGESPSGLPLPQQAILAFDHEENPSLIPANLGLVTQAVALDPAFPEFGWAFFDERHNGPQTLYQDDLAQAWVGHRTTLAGSPSRLGRGSAVFEAACSGASVVLPTIFNDGFESGDTSSWSSTQF